MLLTFKLLNPDSSFFENSVDPDQLASDAAILSGSTLFSTLYMLITEMLQVNGIKIEGEFTYLGKIPIL